MVAVTERIKKITDYIFLKSSPQKADVALVFGTRHKEPLKKISKLYKSKLISKILISGGKNRVTGENEAESMSKELIKLGVLPSDLILEDKSSNTLENIIFSKKILDEKIGLKNIHEIIAVVKHYHSRRALMTLKKHFPKHIKIVPVTYNVYGFTKDNWHKSEIGREKVLGEWNKIPKYLEKGDIEEL